MLVLIYDDFRRDNEATVRRVLRFLDVEETAPIETLETEPLKAVRAVPLFNLTQRCGVRAKTRRRRGRWRAA